MSPNSRLFQPGSGAAGPPGPPGPGDPTTVLTAITEFSYLSGGTFSIHNIPANAIVEHVQVTVDTPFDGAGASIIVGDGGTANKYVAIGDVDLTLASTQEVNKGKGSVPASTVQATLNPGAAPTQGAGRVEIFYSVPAASLAPTLLSITITPVNPTMDRFNFTTQFTATGLYSDASTQDLTAVVTWTSGTPGNATISNAPGTNGLATRVTNIGGTTLISASLLGLSDSTTLTLEKGMVSIAITEAFFNTRFFMAPGMTDQLHLIATYGDASTEDVSAAPGAIWLSSSPTVATVSATGLATAIDYAGLGVTIIDADFGPLSAVPFQLNVDTYTTVAWQTDPLAIAVGFTANNAFRVTFDHYGAQAIVHLVTVVSGNPAIATVAPIANPAVYTFNGVAVGAAVIDGEYNGDHATFTANVS